MNKKFLTSTMIVAELQRLLLPKLDIGRFNLDPIRYPEFDDDLHRGIEVPFKQANGLEGSYFVNSDRQRQVSETIKPSTEWLEKSIEDFSAKWLADVADKLAFKVNLNNPDRFLPLVIPGGNDLEGNRRAASVYDPVTGLHVRLVWEYEISEDVWHTRFDVRMEFIKK